MEPEGWRSQPRLRRESPIFPPAKKNASNWTRSNPGGPPRQANCSRTFDRRDRAAAARMNSSLSERLS